MRVRRFLERPLEEREELTGRIAQVLVQNGGYQGREEAGFYQRYFKEAWARAQETLLGRQAR